MARGAAGLWMCPGARVGSAARRLRGGVRYTVGRNTWYLSPEARATGVLLAEPEVVTNSPIG